MTLMDFSFPRTAFQQIGLLPVGLATKGCVYFKEQATASLDSLGLGLPAVLRKVRLVQLLPVPPALF